jgi:hypothetical protein
MRIDAVASPRARYDGAIGGFPCPGFDAGGAEEGADGGVAGAAVDSVSSAAARTIGEERARRAREEDAPRATTTTARAASDDDDDASDCFGTFDEDAAATRARRKLEDARADATATEEAAERTIGDIVSVVLLVSRRRATTRRARWKCAVANTEVERGSRI